MTTIVHISATPYQDLGMVRLSVDTSGDPPPGGVVVVGRRAVGSTVLEQLVKPAGYMDVSGEVHLVNRSAMFFDTTIPLDTPVEYLAGLPGEDPVVATGSITVDSNLAWRLGDPLRPYLDMTMTLVRTNATACPAAPNAIIMSLSDDSLAGQSESTMVPGSRYPLTNPQPIASPAFEINFATKTEADQLAATALFAPGGILLMRVPDVYETASRYLRVDSVSVARVRSDHRFPWRRFTVQAREEEVPAGAAYGWLGARWADLCSGSYPTWTSALSGGLTWVSAGSGILSGAFPAAMRTYAEVSATWATYTDLIATGKTYTQLVDGD